MHPFKGNPRMTQAKFYTCIQALHSDADTSMANYYDASSLAFYVKAELMASSPR